VSGPRALCEMCCSELVLRWARGQDLLFPFAPRPAGSADTLEIDMERVALILRRTVAEILPEALEWAGRSREARRCRAVATVQEAIAVVKELSGQDWHSRGIHLTGLINSISMATEDYLAF